ncbi:phospholipid-translocating P-type ATPase [Flagelloscypha sp. PMI_526]|nr:phospholipid-translocating P-type ATPase [Flagelloscypha sp. PMI_526]
MAKEKVAFKYRRPSKPNPIVQVYERITSFDLAKLFSTKREPGPPRTIYVNEPLPASWIGSRGKVRKEHRYISNQVISSKYNIFTFVPRNLLEQFRRIANLFFLGIAILQFFPEFTTVSASVVILPLAIIVFLTGAKDGYEDYSRHQADRAVNQSTTMVLHAESGWKNYNATQGKTKTFVRRIFPKRTGKKRGRDADVEYDDDPRDSGSSMDTPLKESYGQGKPRWQRTLWEDVKVGDFVKLHDGEPVPADILICSTSDEENVAFVETKNLDGETNLKSRSSLASLTDLRTASRCANPDNHFSIACDRPESNMYRLNAAVERDGKKTAVDLQTILLRGTVLKNTEWAIGVVLFTGEDSKIILNAGGTPSKRSKVERQMNPQVMINLFLLGLMCTACAIGDSSMQKVQYPQGAPWLWGDNTKGDNPSINGLITWAFALLTFQNIVPISLYLSIEIVRTLQSAWIYFDYDIWYKKTDTPTTARSWNLSDDLGQIEFILSDKTGTLTQNVMVFRQCTIGGVIYKGSAVPFEEDESNGLNEKAAASQSSTSVHNGVARGNDVPIFKDEQLLADIEHSFSSDADPASTAHARLLNGFFTVLALCHTVLTSYDEKTGAIQYKAQSPDEQALVQGAADVGFVYKGRDSNSLLTLSSPNSDEDEKYELLNILEFSSARKRMSAIVKKHGDDGDSRILLLTKGADNIIFDRLRPGNDEMKATTEKHLAEFASDGLRTLTLAYKIIPEAEYNAWNERYHDATVALDDREEKIEAVSEEMEKDLRLLGATAIEDKLQDGVPEAIADLKLAGIKIWVLTGDKLETAMAIGRSTNLIAENNNLIVVRGASARPVQQQLVKAFETFFPDADLLEDHEIKDLEAHSAPVTTPNHLKRMSAGNESLVGADNGNRDGGMILVIDGAGLLEAFENERSKELLLQLGMHCEGVICCRVSPLQKAQVTRLVKDGLGAMTLAIGDGANDVSMIQAADIGVGISGEEGLQAANNADYALAQFRFLKKLLLVHGHWSYARNGIMIGTFFYKNIIAMGVLWWFQIFSGWSGNYVFSYYYLLLWNSVWTLLPVVGIGLFDRIADARDLMDYPELYRYGRTGSWFNYKLFWIYMLDGIYQSTIVYFFIMYTYVSVTSRSDGYDIDQTEFSTTIAVSAVMIADLFTGFAATVWTGWHFFAVSLGIIICWIFTAAYAAISPSYASTDLYGNHFLLFRSPYFWLCLPLVFILATAPRYFYKVFCSTVKPGDLELIKVLRKQDPSRLNSLRCYPYGGQDGDEEGGGHRDSTENFGLAHLRQPSGVSVVASTHMTSRTSLASAPRPSVDFRAASRTDMSTGLTSVEHGFGFSMEEPGGAHLRRIQTDLSERRVGQRGGRVHVSEGDHRRSRSSGKGRVASGLASIGSIGRARRLSQKLKSRISHPHRTSTADEDPPSPPMPEQ